MEWAGQSNMWNNPNGDDALMSLLFAEDDVFAQALLQAGSSHEQQQQAAWAALPPHKDIKQEAPADALFAEWAAETGPLVEHPRAGWGQSAAAAPAPHAARRLITTQLHRSSTKSAESSAHSVAHSNDAQGFTSGDSHASASSGLPSRCSSGNNDANNASGTLPFSALPGTSSAGTRSGSGSFDASASAARAAVAAAGGPGGEVLLGSSTALNNSNGLVVQQMVAYTNNALQALDGGSTQAGWQALLQKLQEKDQPVLPPQPQGAKRGRKPTTIVNGVPIAKPVKDKKRENSILIKQLEAQLAEKLTLVKGLEGENTELKRKERLLQLSVDTSEHNLNRLVDPALDKNLKPMLQSFRSAYNKQAAERVLAKVAHIKSPKDMTYDVFVSCWQALVMEMCDGLMAEATAATPQAKAEAQAHLDLMRATVVDFIMSVCATDCAIVQRAQLHNMNTGEEANITYEFYDSIVDKLAFSKDQLLDLIGAFDMFARLIERNLHERKEIKEELDRAIDLESRAEPSCTSSTYVATASEKLAGNLKRSGVLHTLISFITLRIMTSKQTAQMSMHTSPYFPSLVRLQVAIRKTAEKLGLCEPLPLWQSPTALADAMEGVMEPSGGAAPAAAAVMPLSGQEFGAAGAAARGGGAGPLPLAPGVGMGAGAALRFAPLELPVV